MAANSSLPRPPEDLATRSLPLKRLRVLYRIHLSRFECLHFGKSGGGRFDDPQGGFGVLYAALDPEAAFAEVFLRQLSRMLVPESDFEQRVLSVIESAKPINCVDLTGSGLRRISCDNRIATEKPYFIPGKWARAFYEHPQQPDGIVYLSRHNPACKCAALFDRSRNDLRVTSTEHLLQGARRIWTADQIAKYHLAIQA